LEIFHDKVKKVLVLERRLQLNYPWVVGKSKDVSFGSDMSNLILVDHLLLLHLFNGNDFVGLPVPAYSDLTKCASTDNFLRYEIFNRYLCSLEPIVLRLFMQYLLLNQLLFLIGQVHLIHLMLKLIPSILPLFFFIFSLSILVLNISLGALGFFTSLAGGLDGRGGGGATSVGCVGVTCVKYWRRLLEG
jgi:hypothetical protein